MEFAELLTVDIPGRKFLSVLELFAKTRLDVLQS